MKGRPGFPIVIISFDRTDYLQAVLESLVSQKGVMLDRHPVYLFQDGAVNDFSERQYCDPGIVKRNVALFESIVPHGISVASPANLGVARNFDRAERFVFEGLNADAAVFLEDDLLLGPFYLKTLFQLMELAVDDGRIGYVGAFGNFRASEEEQRRRCSEYTLLGHNWAFGLTRRQWFLQKPYVDQYMAIVAHSDYRGRDHARIAQLFRSWGLGVPGTSQDIAKTHATTLTNTARLSTFACFGKYIGQVGLHFNPEQFEKLGFAGSAMLDEDLFVVASPSDEQLDTFRRIVRESAMSMNPAVPGFTSNPSPERKNRGLKLFEETLAARAAGQHDVVAETCRIGMSTFSDLLDVYGHPLFLKEALRLALVRGQMERAGRLSQEMARVVRPGDPCVPLLFGRHAMQSGNLVGLRHYASEVLRLDPGQPEALEWMKRLT